MFKKIVLTIAVSVLVDAAEQPKMNAQESQSKLNAHGSIAAKPLHCVTHISDIQRIIADYCDQEWVEVTKFPTKDVTSFACSPDGRYIAYALWKKRGGDVQLGKGSTKAVAQTNIELEIWDELTKSAQRTTVPVSAGDLVQLVFMPGQNYLTITADSIWFIDVQQSGCRLVDVSTAWGSVPYQYIVDSPVLDPEFANIKPASLKPSFYDRVSAIAFSPDGNFMARKKDEGAHYYVDCKNSRSFVIPSRDSNDDDIFITKILFSADSRYILGVGQGERFILLGNLETKKIKVLGLPEKLEDENAFAVLPVTDFYAMATHIDPRDGTGRSHATGLLIQNFITGEKVAYNKIGYAIVALAVVNSNYIACATEKGDIKICSLANLQTDVTQKIAMPADFVHSIPPHGAMLVKNLHCSVDGKFLTALLGLNKNARNSSGVIKRWINLSHYLMGK